MEVDFEDEEYLCRKSLIAKGKNKVFWPISDVLELKLRTGRQGKCVGAAPSELITVAKKPQSYTVISNEVWFHLANYIAPEDVKNYSLICSQSANSVNCRLFWLRMFSRYCQRRGGSSKKWVLSLPEELQIYNLRGCDRNILRQKVVQALYRCYPPFQKRLLAPYPLEALEGKKYISSWHKLMHDYHLVCHKFQLDVYLSATAHNKSVASKQIDISGVVADNWECLADETNNNRYEKKLSSGNNVEGGFILLVTSKRFSPLTIICHHDTGQLRFAAGRVLLSSDMKSENMELDFVSTIDERIVTVKYLEVREYKVLPWWHPSFKKFLSC